MSFFMCSAICWVEAAQGGSGQSHNIGILRKRRFVVTASWNAKKTYEEIVDADESNRTHPERPQIG
jgi:hypothetical protein